MAIEVTKKEGESSSYLVSRFLKKVQQSGVLREVRKRQFQDRSISRLKRRLSALHREQKKQEIQKAKKLGLL